MPTPRKIRYAVIGQGYIAQAAVLPAFAHAKRNSVLAAIVSDDPVKRRALAERYRVPEVASYDECEDLFRSGLVDAVYVAVPNSLHRSFVVRAARAGLHVLCEKPLATSVEDAEEMIRECERADVRLMVAYRLHFEAANLEAVRLVETERIGRVRAFSSCFSMQVRPGNVRLRHDLGGGTLWDLGIYCVNAARYLLRDEPEEVFAISAFGTDSRFDEVDEMTTAVLRFPGERFAHFTSSFGAADASWYELLGTEGTLRVDPAFEYAEALVHHLKVGDRETRRLFPKRDQFAPELLHFSDCVLRGEKPEPSGREGLGDVRILEALVHSARTGRPVRLPPFERSRRPEPSQAIRRPPVARMPALVHAEPPTTE
jgi:glucose-fructose oxidoreductase